MGERGGLLLGTVAQICVGFFNEPSLTEINTFVITLRVINCKVVISIVDVEAIYHKSV